MLPAHIRALVEGAETALSITALSLHLQKQGHWHMSPGVVRATCDMLEEEGADIRHVPRTDDLFIEFSVAVTPEPVEDILRRVAELLKEAGPAGVEVVPRKSPDEPMSVYS